MADEFIIGRNAVIEALKSERPVNKVFIAKGETKGSMREIVKLARQQSLIVQEVAKPKLDEMAQGLKHQGVVASVAPVSYFDLEDILQKAEQTGEPPFLVLLEEIQDPHNLGAILRTADASGVHGVLIPKRRSCPLSAAVAKTSAGAIEHVPVARIGNIAQTITQLKQQGFWIVGADMQGQSAYYSADLTGPIVIVVGSEGRGMSRLTKESCDILVQIPMRGKMSSLNVSVACSLLLYEVLRQREK